MKISYNWLKQYLETIPGPQQTAEILTGCGLEVESVEHWSSVKGGLEGVVIGEILTCAKHPDSDHLSLTTVHIGLPDPIHIVCGAPNVATGQKVAVATIGATLYFADKEMVIHPTKLHGIISQGMICAEDELGLGTSHKGIMVLDPAAIAGTPAKEYFRIEEDWIFEIGLTPNRSDAASHVGVARDLAAVLCITGNRENVSGNHLRLPDVGTFRAGENKKIIDVIIQDVKACPRYSGLTILNVKVKESPGWLRNRLNAIGSRPINNIVDITNFILQELGQPLHVFDADKIKGDRVVIRKMPEGTPFITLDEVERKLTGNDLMICNTEEPMCIAGVFGGIESGVTTETKNIFLESAYFDPGSIRRTARQHGLQTDASFRFERGADYSITPYALKRAALLIQELAGGEISGDIVDVYPEPIKNPEVILLWSNLERLTGEKIPVDIVKTILHSLNIEIKEQNETRLVLVIPSYKTDVTREADVIEEILRIYGYNNIGFSSSIKSAISYTSRPDLEKVKNVISDFLSANGFYEIMNNSLTSAAYYETNQKFRKDHSVLIRNPLSKDLNAMRQTLLYGGLESVVYNQNRKNPDLRFYEFGNTYILEETNDPDPLKKYKEGMHLALFLSGKAIKQNWNAKERETDLFDLKGYINAILVKAGIDQKNILAESYSDELITDGIALRLYDRPLVYYGYVRKSLLKQIDSKQAILYADIDWDLLVSGIPLQDTVFKGLPKYPEVKRDLALLMDQSISFSDIETLAYETERKLLKKISLFDVYEGESIGPGKKSYAVSFTLLDERKTLTDEEIERVMKRFIRAFTEKLHAVIR